MHFTILLILWSKKVNIVVKWWGSILTRKLWWLKNNDDFKNSTKCWISDNDYVDNDVKVRDH